MLEAPFLLIRAALPGMYERNFGRIINVSSVHGLRASAFKSAYVAAKHGLERLSKVTALEGGCARGHQQLCEPGLRTHSAGRKAANGAGRRSRNCGIGSVGAHHAHRERDQTPSRARRSRLPGRLACLRSRGDGHRGQLHDGWRLVGALTPVSARCPAIPVASGRVSRRPATYRHSAGSGLAARRRPPQRRAGAANRCATPSNRRAFR